MELKKCPHCGGTARLVRKSTGPVRDKYYVVCCICGARGRQAVRDCEDDQPLGDPEALAAEAWNMRTA